jgi:hypothetical protein
MTMMHAAHPAPERLAALAGGDADALADRELTSHVKGCVTCDRQVLELNSIQAALADLPDLTPSRPLQLIPPVSEPVRPSGWRLAFRRAFAPIAVAGLALVLVGGLGVAGQLGSTDPVSFVRQLTSPMSAGQQLAPEEPAAAPPADNSGTGPAGGDGETGFLPTTPEPDVNSESLGNQPTERDDVQALAATALSWTYIVAIGLGLLVLAFVMWIAGAPQRIAARR